MNAVHKGMAQTTNMATATECVVSTRSKIIGTTMTVESAGGRAAVRWLIGKDND